MKTNLKFVLLLVALFGLFGGGIATAQAAALSAASGSESETVIHGVVKDRQSRGFRMSISRSKERISAR